MVKFHFVLVSLLLHSSSILFAQQDTLLMNKTHSDSDTLANFVRIGMIPTFSIQLPDSTWFSRSQLSDKKSTLLLYFSPDCGHCMLETEEIISKMKQLKNLQIVMITSKPYEEMRQFNDYYKINRFKNIKIGRDAQRTITRFYNIKFTPFSALYNKNSKLVKWYEKGIDWPELITLLED